MAFWQSIGNFFTNFFKNAAADPTSTMVGISKLSSAAAICYGMSNGAVPVNALSIGAAASMVAGGVHNIGTNTSGVTSAPASAVESAMAVVTQAAPVAMSVVDQLAAMKTAASNGQKQVDLFNAVTTAIATVIPVSGSTPPTV